MERIEAFEQGGKKFIYFDLSEFTNNDEFRHLIALGKEMIKTYEPHSVCTIVNIANIMFDSETKDIFLDWANSNKPYVENGVITHSDGIQRIMFKEILRISERGNMKFLTSKEKAVEWLLQVDK